MRVLYIDIALWWRWAWPYDSSKCLPIFCFICPDKYRSESCLVVVSHPRPQAVDQIGALAVQVVLRDIPSSCGGGDSFSTLVHSGTIPAIWVVA